METEYEADRMAAVAIMYDPWALVATENVEPGNYPVCSSVMICNGSDGYVPILMMTLYPAHSWGVLIMSAGPWIAHTLQLPFPHQHEWWEQSDAFN